MFTRRIFYGTLLVVVLAKPASGIIKMAARRWANETTGPLRTIGVAIAVAS